MAVTISVERIIRAGPQRLYDLVSDLPRMGEWSPENTGGRWVKGAVGPAVGAHFKGSNRSGWRRWSTDVEITTARAGEQFAFEVTSGPFKIANWDYRFEQSGDATVVTETWTDQRNPLVGKITGLLVGVPDRPAHNRRTMEATLAKLAAAAEQ